MLKSIAQHSKALKRAATFVDVAVQLGLLERTVQDMAEQYGISLPGVRRRLDSIEEGKPDKTLRALLLRYQGDRKHEVLGRIVGVRHGWGMARDAILEYAKKMGEFSVDDLMHVSPFMHMDRATLKAHLHYLTHKAKLLKIVARAERGRGARPNTYRLR